MPEIFPETAPGNFTWNAEMNRYVMTVFNSYQWDLNYSNPAVLIEMINNILFWANRGADILRLDIALKALSPGINDTTTAVMCVDYLAAIIVHLASRDIPSSYRYKNGTLRLMARGATFQSLVSEAFDQVRQNAGNNVAVLVRQAEALEVISRATDDPDRKDCVRRQVELIWIVAESTVAAHEVEPIKRRTDKLIQELSQTNGLM